MRTQERLVAALLGALSAASTWLLGHAALTAAQQLTHATASLHSSQLVIIAAISAAGAAISGWYCLGLSVTAARGLSSSGARFLAPGVSRAVRLGAAILTACAIPLGAGASDEGVPHGDLLPPLPTTSAPALPAAAPARPQPVGLTHRVAPGECLWTIATTIHPTASVQQRAALVAELVRVNPAITDADLIYPGQVLNLPEVR
ncbi:MAG: LysM domain-containing protein [Bowdeniella nasicola]|nr:LysM domain-containing protein [Bowdeniella nasicola]